MKLTVIGCGDAFGSGGRLQTSYFVESASARFLIDCGATTVIGCNRLNIDPNAVPTIFISHLHGDHFAGLVWWLLHAQHIGKRTEPLSVIGPPGIEARFITAAEALFPGCTGVPRRYDLHFREYEPGNQAMSVGPVNVTAYEVKHASGAPPYALRFEFDGQVLGFTGDTEWVDNLVPAGKNADLYIMECYQFDGAPRYHMSWQTIESKLDEIGARRILLTHMASSMLERRGEISDPRAIFAEDGLTVRI